jgi:UDP-N-acetylglucosamine 3-dehydrogenase
MIRVGLLGTGFMGKTHASAFAQTQNARVTAIVGSSPERTAPLAQEHQAKVHRTIDDLLNDPDIDAVDICLPTPLHEPVVVAAAQAGKHILCEKPITLTLDAATNMVEQVRQSGVIAMVAQVVRFWPQYTATHALLASGQFTRPHHVGMYRLASVQGWSSWFADPAQSGGALIDLQIHDLDFLYSLFGLPERVYTSGTRIASGAWNHLQTTLTFADTTATVEASYMMPTSYPFRAGFRMVGADGCVEYDFRVTGQVDQRASAQHEFTLYRMGEAPVALAAPAHDPYQAQATYFADCVQSCRTPTFATLAEARTVLLMALAAQDSLVTGQSVSLAERDMKGSYR